MAEKPINILRNALVVLLFSPFFLLIHLTAFFRGRKKAVLLWGPVVTFLAKGSLRFWVPNLESPNDFDTFSSRMRANFRLWRPFYDVRVVEDTADTFKINVSNCPFCEACKLTGLSDLRPYLCQGDWAKADENRDKWLFEREHQIGTGDSFCDHTYKRKRECASRQSATTQVN